MASVSFEAEKSMSHSPSPSRSSGEESRSGEKEMFRFLSSPGDLPSDISTLTFSFGNPKFLVNVLYI